MYFYFVKYKGSKSSMQLMLMLGSASHTHVSFFFVLFYADNFCLFSLKLTDPFNKHDIDEYLMDLLDCAPYIFSSNKTTINTYNQVLNWFKTRTEFWKTRKIRC